MRNEKAFGTDVGGFGGKRCVGVRSTNVSGLRIAGFFECAYLGVFIFALCAVASGQSEQSLSAGQLLRKTVDTELKAAKTDHSHWMYQDQTGSAQKQEVKWVVETPDGDLDHLRSINGKPISRDREKQEEQRISNLLHHSDLRSKRKRAQQEDANQMERLFKMLPDALTARYGERKGDLVEILFEPNPNFRPPTREATVFHEMAGHMWINQKENRLAEIDGHLMAEVKFWGGLLGYLDKGGKFHVQQSEVAPGHWEVTLLHVDMRGKALFFKTISVQQNEIRTNFRQVPDNLTLAQAAQELHKQCTSQSAASFPPSAAFEPAITSAKSFLSERLHSEKSETVKNGGSL